MSVSHFVFESYLMRVCLGVGGVGLLIPLQKRMDLRHDNPEKILCLKKNGRDAGISV